MAGCSFQVSSIFFFVESSSEGLLFHFYVKKKEFNLFLYLIYQSSYFHCKMGYVKIFDAFNSVVRKKV